jgi:hypothetical protein
MIGPVFVRRTIDPFTVRAGKGRLEWLLDSWSQGLCDREIAQEMGVSEETAKRYMRELYRSKGIDPTFRGRRARLIVGELEARKVAGNPADSECAGERE